MLATNGVPALIWTYSNYNSDVEVKLRFSKWWVCLQVVLFQYWFTVIEVLSAAYTYDLSFDSILPVIVLEALFIVLFGATLYLYTCLNAIETENTLKNTAANLLFVLEE